MAHSLTVTPATAATLIPTNNSKKAASPPPGFQRVWACHGDSNPLSVINVHRRWHGPWCMGSALGLAGAVLGLNIGGQNANAARRPPPPPPPEKKKDPSLSGVQAKVLASKKRKEAMKQAVAKLKEKANAINEPSE